MKSSTFIFIILIILGTLFLVSSLGHTQEIYKGTPETISALDDYWAPAAETLSEADYRGAISEARIEREMQRLVDELDVIGVSTGLKPLGEEQKKRIMNRWMGFWLRYFALDGYKIVP